MKEMRCKGMRDLMPDEMAKFRRIEAEFRDCCLGWGYQEIRTPTLEYLHLFTSAGTLSPDMLGRVYSFLDWDGWSGERVVLRPDGTIPTARLYVENLQDLSLARLFYVENTFAFEGTGEESRERWQCGVELIGGSQLEGDFELITVALETFKKLDIGPIQVRLAHAGVLKTFLESLGLHDEEEAAVLDQIFSGSRGVLTDIGGGNPEIQRQLDLIFGLQGSSSGFIETLKGAFSSTIPELGPSLDELAKIAEILTGLGYDYLIDFMSGRNFEYYTGVIFGFYSPERRIGGGGRYDKLVPLVGGKDVCASGFALYIDELMELFEGEQPPKKILIKTSGGEGLKTSLELSKLLRKAGYVAEFDLGYKETSGFRWVVDMTSGEGIELVNQANGQSCRGSSSGEILELLGGM